jgi:hypothetical protein
LPQVAISLPVGDMARSATLPKPKVRIGWDAALVSAAYAICAEMAMATVVTASGKAGVFEEVLMV